MIRRMCYLTIRPTEWFFMSCQPNLINPVKADISKESYTGKFREILVGKVFLRLYVGNETISRRPIKAKSINGVS